MNNKIRNKLVVDAPSRYRLKPLVSHMIEKGLLASSLMAGHLLLAPLVQAGPEGGVVVSGSGSVTQVTNLDTHISQQSQNLLMNFDSFDVAVNESVRISQPNVSSLFVGQIVGASPTTIFGSVSANGRVALVNPRGVIFGESATINAAGIFASALGLVDGDIFSDENINFASEPGAGGFVVNHGLINASVGGSVSLLGESVTNTGVIIATLGQVNLATGSRAVVNFGPDQLIGIEITEEVLQNNQGLKAAISNTGSIDATGGAVILTSSVSKSLFDTAINNDGVVKAQASEYKDGVIRLFSRGAGVVNTGLLDVSASSDAGAGGSILIQSDAGVQIAEQGNLLATGASAAGGSVTIEAQAIAIEGSAVLDVSGRTGGGSVQLSAVEQAVLGEHASIRADAIDAGKGGAVEVLANDVSVFGAISARGGSLSGEGGQITLAADGQLTLSGSLDVGASSGVAGSVNLNAPTIEINDVAAEGVVTVGSLQAGAANIQINATNNVVVGDLQSNLLNLGDSALTINVNGFSEGAQESDAIAFVMAGANDEIISSQQVAINVTDGSLNANGLIDIAGTIRAQPFPSPLPNDPLSPGNNISLAALNGRVRIRSSAQLISLADNADNSDATAGNILIQATGYQAENQAGEVLFSGVADVTNAAGVAGEIRILGDKVGLYDAARINASGATGGGIVLVGGDFQGAGIEQNAIETFVGDLVTINADAILDGDGGKVIIWADDLTRYHGEISATGGSFSGDGGFAEVSGKDQLMFRGGVDLGSATGQLGTLLLDPNTIEIIGGDGTDSNPNVPAVTMYEDNLELLNADVLLEADEAIFTSGTFVDGLDLMGALTLKTTSASLVGIDIGVALRAKALTITTSDEAAPINLQSITTDALTPAAGGISLSTAGDVNILGEVDAFGAVTVTGSTLTLANNITAGGEVDLASNVSNIALTGNVTIDNIAGADDAISLASTSGAFALTLTGDKGAGVGSAVNLGNIIDVGSLAVTGNVLTLGGNLTVDQSLNLGSTVNSISLSAATAIDVAAGGDNQSISLASTTGA
ncbi:MAG: filamentous hemagglutinin N-terminal domain-containing protein, partial [Pseudomonadales bacterium]|nr:filamentous hemagglutinin N-terminal domain-containing protein [Pseudomonadales bacterium]